MSNMQEEEIKRPNTFPPIVDLKRTEGSMILGKIKKVRDGDYGKTLTLEYVDAHTAYFKKSTGKKDPTTGKTIYDEVSVNKGDLVDLGIGEKGDLAEMAGQLGVDDGIRVIFNGKTFNPKTGHFRNTWTVSRVPGL